MRIPNLPILWRGMKDAIRYGQDLDYERFMVAHGDYRNLCEDFDTSDGYVVPTEEGLERAKKFVARAKNWTEVAWWLYGLYSAAKIAKSYLHCELFDHDLKDASSIGPDSGTERIYCARCGWSWEHTYY